MNSITVKNINISGNRISVSFDVDGSDEWVSCFVKPYEDVSEYDVQVDTVPESIAVIPFVSNILPAMWLFDAELKIEELDRNFYDSIPDFKKGFEEMYKDFVFGGKLSVNRIVENSSGTDKSIVLFSGGVDAFFTLVSNIEQKPSLVCVWGADVKISNTEGWTAVERHVRNSAQNLGLDAHTVKSSFRDYLSFENLSEFLKRKCEKLEWYHDFQHGPVLICLMAPLSYIIGAGKVYISSSFSPELIGNYTCASDPTIDNYIRYADTVVEHFGYESNRQEKIHEICEFNSANRNVINLRVCWMVGDGTNCCLCEKCIRTMLAIIAEGKNPADYGFEKYNDDVRTQMLGKLKNTYRPQFQYNRYFCIQEKLRNTFTYSECPDDLKWFYKVKLRRTLPTYYKIYRKMSVMIHKILKK